jgi:hypothetical protein
VEWKNRLSIVCPLRIIDFVNLIISPEDLQDSGESQHGLIMRATFNSHAMHLPAQYFRRLRRIL